MKVRILSILQNIFWLLHRVSYKIPYLCCVIFWQHVKAYSIRARGSAIQKSDKSEHYNQGGNIMSQELSSINEPPQQEDCIVDNNERSACVYVREREDQGSLWGGGYLPFSGAQSFVWAGLFTPE